MSSAENNCYLCEFCTKSASGYFIWLSGDIDGVLLNTNGQLLTSSDLPELLEFAKTLGSDLTTEDSPLYKFDTLEDWLANPHGSTVDCGAFLNAWNLFDEVAHSVGATFAAKHKSSMRLLYDKLFFGCNLPSITPEAEAFIPTWSSDELKTLAEIMHEGLQLFERSVAASKD